MKMTKFNPKVLGDRLYMVRRKHNLKQDVLADISEITRAAYSGIETGRYGASINVLIRIINFYRDKHSENLTMDYLIGLADSTKELIRIEEKHAEMVRNLTDENRELKKKIEYQSRENGLLSEQLKKCNNNLTKALEKIS